MSFLDEEAVLPDEHIVPTEEVEKVTPPEATTETKPEAQDPSPDGANSQDDDKLPFHKHPRWKQREDEWSKTLTETKADYEERISQLEEKFSPLLKPNEKISVPAFFAKVYGDDPELYKEWLAEEDARTQKIKDETIAEYEHRQVEARQKVEAETKRWTDWVDTSIKTLKDKGEEFDENELKAIAIKYKPTDEMGNIDFGLALELLKERKTDEKVEADKKSTARKEIAGATKSSSKGESKERDYLTHDDIRKGRANA